MEEQRCQIQAHESGLESNCARRVIYQHLASDIYFFMFDELWENWDWRPIRNCPGRFILRGAKADLSLEELAGGSLEVIEYKLAAAKDLVLVAALDKGGLISYKRPDGSFLHTLNTQEGFRRKLQQLGVNTVL